MRFIPALLAGVIVTLALAVPFVLTDVTRSDDTTAWGRLDRANRKIVQNEANEMRDRVLLLGGNFDENRYREYREELAALREDALRWEAWLEGDTP